MPNINNIIGVEQKKLKIYVAGDWGFTERGSDFLYNKVIPLLEEQELEILNPWKLTTPEEVEKVYSMPNGIEKDDAVKRLNHLIGRRNINAIEESDFIFACLEGQEIDSGTASEIGFAYALKKTISGYRSDFRQSGDNYQTKINLQVQYFIEDSGGRIISSISELSDEIKRVKKLVYTSLISQG